MEKLYFTKLPLLRHNEFQSYSLEWVGAIWPQLQPAACIHLLISAITDASDREISKVFLNTITERLLLSLHHKMHQHQSSDRLANIYENSLSGAFTDSKRKYPDACSVTLS